MKSIVRGWRFERGHNTICFVGDIHGAKDKLEQLWHNIPKRLGSEDAFDKLQVVFLGDYCDKGPDTKGVLDWLVGLGARHPQQSHHFLCGNHDFALASFLGLLPERHSHNAANNNSKTFIPPAQGDYSATWRDNYTPQRPEGELYKGPGHERMHLQGVRFAATPSSPFTSHTTFESYGVEYGDREGLLAAMPNSHLEFIANLEWIVKLRSQIGDVVAVHAGLEDEDGSDLERMAHMLNSRDPALLHLPFIEPLCGKANVERMPSALQPRILRKRGYIPPPLFLVSGHHGFVKISGRRIIMDMCGGKEGNDLGALLLSREGGVGSSHTQVSNDIGVSMNVVTSTR
eukprot:CAMPEP_0184507426 /NCGR_PEP_ID=MMETSP0198_2-20121128/236_1 /TAXON_ID=1112570 /ORGANISM="Thraustochytrium sp., Strain LLF1b" /LENGTH=343 /DNA_ID=CAMNT_0026897173 /DNA_START=387 /DNA_END=1418 /DNA_ORIENTATION=-